MLVLLKKPTSHRYQPNPRESVPRRLASYLYWASQTTPRQAIDLPMVAKSVLGLARKPRLTGSAVKKIKKALHAARRILGKEHNASIVSYHGKFLRATVGNEDFYDTICEQKLQRALDAIRRLKDLRTPRLVK